MFLFGGEKTLSRTNISGTRTKVLEIPKFNGINTAASFSEIDITQSRDMVNALPNSLGGLAKRSGTKPITTVPIGAVKTLCNFRSGNVNNILAVSQLDGVNKLYKLVGGEFVHQLGAVETPYMDYAQFKDANGQEVLIMTVGGWLKYYNGTLIVDIVSAADDPSPLPPNDLDNIRTKGLYGCVVHNTRVVLWSQASDTIWHSKIGYFDYYPSTDFQRFVRENDVVQTCVTYRGALIVLMRRHIGVLFGHDRDDWSQDFLDTVDGCLNPRTVQTVTYPDGSQEVFYLSDNGVHAVYAIDTLSLDSSARYSTRNVTINKIDWDKLGATKSEWEQATAHFIDGKYWLIYKKGAQYKGLVFDTNTKEWYPVENIKADCMTHDDDNFYFAGEDGLLKNFDKDSYSDWNDKNKTTGTPVNMYWYSKLMTPKLTGFDHFWDILMVEAKQFNVQSSLDVEVNTQRDEFSGPSSLKTAVFVWGETKWGEAEWANQKLTDIVNNAKRLRTFLKGQYAQIKLSNNRDEPVEIYGIRFETRPMDTYY